MTSDQMVATGVLSCGGACFFLVGLIPLALWLRFRRMNTPARGVVVGYEVREQTGEDAGTHLHHPVAVFRDQYGTERRATLDGASGRTVAEGEEVNILYDPADPAHARADGPAGVEEGKTLRLFGLLFPLLGILCVLWGLAIWAFSIPVSGR